MPSLLPLLFLILLPLYGEVDHGVGPESDSPLHVHVTVFMAGDGFMCPFLTPQFLDVVQSRAHWVEARPLESEVEFVVPLEQAWSKPALRGVLADIGYPADGVSFLQWDTVGVIPPSPAQ